MLWQPHICRNIISVPQKLKIGRSINCKEETLFSQLALTCAGFDQNGLEHICKMEGIQEKLKHTEISVHLQRHKSDILPKGKCRSHVLFDELF